MTKTPNPAILAARADRGGSILRFEAARQDRRLYYRLLLNDRSCGSLTDETHALQAIAYWREKGWLK